MTKGNRNNRQTPSSPSVNRQSSEALESLTDLGITRHLSEDPERVGRTIPCLSPIDDDECLGEFSQLQSNHSNSRTNVFMKAYLEAGDSDEDLPIVPGVALPYQERTQPVSHGERTSMLQLDLLDDDEDEVYRSGEKESVSRSGSSETLGHVDTKRTDGVRLGNRSAVHSFEGTNEIFIKSSAFDVLFSEEELAPLMPEHKVEGKLGVPAIPPPRETRLKSSMASAGRGHEASNFFGIVSSGILPTVDLDKSFDAPCIDEGMLLEEASESYGDAYLNASVEGTGEVFVSKLLPVVENSDSAGENSSRNGRYGLPSRSVQLKSELHPEDLRGESGTISSETRFAIDGIYHPHRGDLLGVDVEGVGVERNVERLFAYMQHLPRAEKPIVVSVKSSCGLSLERVLRVFLLQCAEHLHGFHAYTSVSPWDGTTYDVVTSLVLSRLGSFLDMPEEARSEFLVKRCNELFEQSDLRWALNILAIRFGLPRLLKNAGDTSKLTERNGNDMLELLQTLLQKDSVHGPVVIVVSRACLECGHEWRDVLRQLQLMPSGNILLIITDRHAEVAEVLSLTETIELSELEFSDIHQIMRQTFLESGLSMSMASMLAAKSGKRFVDIRRLLCYVRERGLFQSLQQARTEDEIASILSVIPAKSQDISDAAYLAFGDAQRRFLGVASLLGDAFYLYDLAFILSLEPLEGEIAWFRDMRKDWCQKVAQSLVKTGELIVLHEDKKRGVRYSIPDAGLYRSRMAKYDSALTRHVLGCYARLLVRLEAEDDVIAEAFGRAHLWPEYTQYILKIARRLGKAFYNRSAYAILQECLVHVGPQHDSIYAELLKETTEQAMRLGKYDEACACAEILSRYGYLVQDALCTCTAFLQLGTCLRMQGAYGRAQDVLLFAIKHAESKHHEKLIAQGYHALAELVLDVGEKGALVNALRYAEKSLELSRAMGDLTLMAATQTLCARIYMLRGEPRRAKTAASESYQALTVSGRWYDTPWPMAVLVECSAALGEPLPLEYLDRGFEIADKTGSTAQLFMMLSTRLKLRINTLQRQAVRNDLAMMAGIIEKQPLLPWVTHYHYFVSQFDYSRKNFHKTSDALKRFFEHASKLGNTFLISQGYALSAVLNFEVHRRKLGKISLEKTDKLYRTSTAAFESVGAWHAVAENLRNYANFLEYSGRSKEAEEMIKRADKVDPYCQ